jgi:hypothetical protein
MSEQRLRKGACRRWGLLTVGLPALGVAAFLTYRQLLRAGFLKYNEYDRRARGRLRVGALAPDLELVGYGGEPVRLATFWTDRPLFLIFGSCT